MTHHYPTLVVHGFLANKMTNLPVHTALRRKGMQTYNVSIPGNNTQDIRISSDQVAAKARAVMTKHGSDKINLVGVSMGGVIALHYLRCNGGHEVVRRTLTLGSPLNGASFADMVGKIPGFGGDAAAQMSPSSNLIKGLHAEPVPEADIVSIYAGGDAMVPPESARIAGARNIKAPVGSWPMGHYQLVLDPRNLAFIADELTR